MVVSKRVANAKSERHYKNTGPLSKKKEQTLWQSLKKKINNHPWMMLAFLILMIASGIASFYMHEKPTRSSMF